MVYNHNIPPKRKEKVKKPTSSELNDLRIETFMGILAKEKTITYDDMQDIMDVGDGVFERLFRKIKGKCSDIAKWNKKDRTFTYTPMTPERVLAKREEKKRNELISSPDIETESISIPIESKIVS